MQGFLPIDDSLMRCTSCDQQINLFEVVTNFEQRQYSGEWI